MQQMGGENLNNPRILMQTMGLNQSGGAQRPQAAPDQFVARTQPVGGFQQMPGGTAYSPPNVRRGGDYGYRPLPSMNPPVQPPMEEGRVFAGGSARFDERTGTYRQPPPPVQAPPQGGHVYVGGSARFDERTGQYRTPPSIQQPPPAQAPTFQPPGPRTSQEAYAQGGLSDLIRFAQTQRTPEQQAKEAYASGGLDELIRFAQTQGQSQAQNPQAQATQTLPQQSLTQQVLQAAYGANRGSANYNEAADLNSDGKVNLVDLGMFSSGRTGNASPSQNSPAQARQVQPPQRQTQPTQQDMWRQAIYSTLWNAMNRRSAQPVQLRYRMF